MPSFRIGFLGTAAMLVGALGTLSCAGGPAPEVTGPNHMYEHFGQVAEIQSALVAGDLEATRAPARWLATHRDDAIPEEGAASVEKMRTEARIIGQQPGFLEAGRALGRLGAACGSCHEATGGGPDVSMSAPPSPAPGGAAHMKRHAWGVDRLWEGLFVPSDAAWSDGAGALLGMPADFGNNDQANRLAKRVHELGRAAQRASTPKERVDTYAELMETCSLCHGALGLRLR